MSEEAQQPQAIPAAVTSEPDLVLTDPVNWSAMSHRELFDAVHRDNEPAQGHELARKWTDLAAVVDEGSSTFADSVRNTESGWQGEAAEAARAHLLELTRRSAAITEVMRGIGECLAEQSTTMERAKAAMPEPANFDLDEVLRTNFGQAGLEGLVAAAAPIKAASDAADSRHQQAVDVMTTMEADSRRVDSRVPSFAAISSETRQVQALGFAPSPPLSSEGATSAPGATSSAASVSPTAEATTAANGPQISSVAQTTTAQEAVVGQEPTVALRSSDAAGPAATRESAVGHNSAHGSPQPGASSVSEQPSATNAAAAAPAYTASAPGGAGPVPGPGDAGSGTAPQWAAHTSAQGASGRTPKAPAAAAGPTVRISRPRKRQTEESTKKLHLPNPDARQSSGNAHTDTGHADTARINTGGRTGGQMPGDGGMPSGGPSMPPNPATSQPPPAQQNPTSPAGDAPSGPPRGLPSGSPGVPGGGAGSAGVGGGAQTSSPGGSATPLQPGGSSAAGPITGAPGSGTSAPQPGPGGSSGQAAGAYGGPMGAGGAGARQGGNEDAEHKSRGYLKDQSVVGEQERGAPPVIGEKFKKKQH